LIKYYQPDWVQVVKSVDKSKAKFYLCVKKMSLEIERLLRIVFPCWLFGYFDLVRIEDSENQLDVYLYEKKGIKRKILLAGKRSEYSLP
jgi:hypothetical protein